MLEYRGIVFSEIGENLSVQFDVGFFKLSDEFRVGNAFLAGGGVDFDLPKPAKVSLFLLPVGKLERPGMKQGLFSLSEFGLSSPHKTLRVL